MKRSIFARLTSKVFWALLILQAGCDVPSSPVQYKDSLEAEGDSLIPLWLTRTKVPSASIAVFRNRQIQFVNGYGLADISNDASVTGATRFQIVSVPKTINDRPTLKLAEDRNPGGKTGARIICAVFKRTKVDFSDLCNQIK